MPEDGGVVLSRAAVQLVWGDPRRRPGCQLTWGRCVWSNMSAMSGTPSNAMRGISLKLDRAQEHLLELDAAIGEYLDSEPYKPVRNFPPSNQHLMLIEFHVVNEPDERLGVIIGDCVHNLRSSLDHLACRLVESNGGTPKLGSGGAQFPIMDRQPTDKAHNPIKPTVNGGVAPNVLAIIDGLQPYQRGQGAASHELAMLRDLSNADKHHLLHTTIPGLTDAKAAIHSKFGTLVSTPEAGRVVHHEGSIGALPLLEPYDEASLKTWLGPDAELEVEASAFVGIKDPGAWSGKPVTVVLEGILNFVRGTVVAQLAPFL